MDQTAASRPTPVHLWVVGGLGLLWNSFGCYDYAMTHLDPAGYLGGMGLDAAAITYMTTLPAWLTACWAVGVWASLAGSLLLLARSRQAVAAFSASLLGFVVSQVAEALLPRPAGMMSSAMWLMSTVIGLALLGQLLYANRQAGLGVLR